MKKVSIITPWYNGKAFVDRYMKMLLAQTYQFIELIFVDDGSTDGVIERIREYESEIKRRDISFIYLFQKHAGQAAATNKGLRAFTGEYFMIVDSDDILTSDCIEKRVAFLDKYPQYSMVTSKGWEAEEDDLGERRDVYWMQRQEEEDLFEKIVERKISTFLLPYLFRTSDFLQTFPDRLIYVNDKTTIQDIQIILPMTYYYKCGFIDEYLFTYVIRQSSGCHEFISYPHKLSYYDGLEEIWLDTYKRINMLEEEYTKCITKTKIVYRQYRNTILCNYLLEHSEKNKFPKSFFYERKLVIFGAGDFGELLYDILKRKNIDTAFFIDNSVQRQKDGFCSIKVKNPLCLKNLKEKYSILVAGSFYNQEMKQQLEDMGFIEKKDFYVYPSDDFINAMKLFNISCESITLIQGGGAL